MRYVGEGRGSVRAKQSIREGICASAYLQTTVVALSEVFFISHHRLSTLGSTEVVHRCHYRCSRLARDRVVLQLPVVAPTDKMQPSEARQRAH